MRRPRAMSLRSRLLAGVSFVAVVLVIVSIVLTITTKARLIDQIDARLTAFAPGGRVPYLDDDDVPAITDWPEPPEGYEERVSDAYQGFIRADGTVITRFVPNVGDREYGTPDVDLADVPSSGRRILTVGSTVGDVTYRVLVDRVGDVTVVTGLPIDDVEATISQLVWVEVLGSLGILAALGLVGWWVVHLGIRPIKEMTATASRIADGDLTVRVPETRGGTESGELASSLNRMLTHIEDAIDQRAESEERLRRFVADASHELRTPVTTIRGYAELYRHGGLADPAMLDDAMRRTEQEAARMGRLVEDMLVLARLDEERPLDPRPLDLVVLARDAVADARAVAPERPIELDAAVPAAQVLGDDDRLRQVLANVVGNALVHTDATVPITVRVRRDRDRDEFVVEVADRGPGMPADVAERVTERFFRADPARSRHRGGSGLGMSIVEAAVAAHGGRVEIDSQPGVGTTVRLWLPAPTDA